MNISIDRDGCIGCGQCAETCPDVFAIADDGLAEVMRQPGEAEEALAQAAADGCPVSVIHTDE
ncbi:MAG: ferredoxin [Eubacteriales bacterium]|nr:ferredoxin [Eubacteriales bacterium]